MILGGSSKFDLNIKSLDEKDINKILEIKNNDENKNAHIKCSLVFFASNCLERFKNSFEINLYFEYISNFKMK
jgi:hypothetical protein